MKEKETFCAALFLAGKPIELATLQRIAAADADRLAAFASEFNGLSIGLHIRSVGGGYQMVADPALSEDLESFFGEKSETLSRNALETVSIIAYKQPVTKAEVDQIRGVDSSGSMRTLIDKNFITVSGRKNVAGKPLLYITTPYFLEHFGLEDLSELPTFKEWKELRGNL
ncbi:MAG: SMC-Scp complex subunit ScpB [Deferribacteraceae bacterium]|jgi:segregation and condensation protein B|nr:SMC-Scp complex subunit ScpB [Deferribacteraceae bacterium]